VHEANLTGAELSRAILVAADLSGAKLGGAKITQAQLNRACGTNVELDPGLTLKPCSTSAPAK
jgi:uncharacterized protein YjbI with pentapeptide repeats